MEVNSQLSPKFSTMTTPSYNVRSISFPARSNPAVQTIQQHLNKLSNSPPSSPKAEAVVARISGLGDVYKCLDSLLHLQSTQQFLSEDPKLVSEMLDDLIRFLDVCNSTKDGVLAVKESVRQLQSSLRRSKAAGEDNNHSSFQSEIDVYFSSRKRMKKEAAKSLASLKTKNPQIEASDSVASVVKALKETNSVTVSVFTSLLLFLSASIVKPKGKKWPQILSKIIVGKEPAAVGCESQEENENEMQKVERALNDLCDSGKEEMESAKRMLEALDSSMGELEDELECLFRQLIQCRVSLLNIVSQVQLE